MGNIEEEGHKKQKDVLNSIEEILGHNPHFWQWPSASSQWSPCPSLPWPASQSPPIYSVRRLQIRKQMSHCSTAFLWRIKISAGIIRKHALLSSQSFHALSISDHCWHLNCFSSYSTRPLSFRLQFLTGVYCCDCHFPELNSST